MSNNIIFNHNFCESILNNYNSPEILNSYSSFFISIIPIVMGFPENIHFKNVSYMLLLNGFFSFYYHYYLSWSGKQLDEVTMILANYHGINGLIQLYSNKTESKLNLYNSMFMTMFIILNTIPQLDFLFPHIFGVYICSTVYLLNHSSKRYNCRMTVLLYLSYSLLGAIFWIISEVYCHPYTKYGHVFWHMLFPFGFYKILKIYDNLSLTNYSANKLSSPLLYE